MPESKGSGLKVSVVVPVYNTEPYLAQCMDSIVGQTLREIEIICVDDGSTDCSYKILESYRRRDPRVKVLRQKNQYAGVARNNGMRIATGEYIIFLDSDDYFRSDCLEKFYERAKALDADIVVCGHCSLYDDIGTELAAPFPFGGIAFSPEKETITGADHADTFFQQFAGWPWDKLFRLEFLKKRELFFQTFRALEDNSFVRAAMATAERISLLPERLAVHRYDNPFSLENTRTESWRSVFLMLQALWDEMDRLGVAARFKKTFDNTAVGFLVDLLDLVQCMDAYTSAFYEIRKTAVDKYCLLDHDPEYYCLKDHFERLQKIVLSSPTEYLVWVNRRTKERYLKESRKYVDVSLRLQSEAERAARRIESKRWMLPKGVVPTGSRLAIYGAGVVGKDFFEQLSDSRSYEVAIWVDRKAGEHQKKGLPVQLPEALHSCAFDYIIIAVLDREIADEIRGRLLRMGFPDEKLYWSDLLGRTKGGQS